MRKILFVLAACLALVLFFTACTAGPNAAAGVPDASGELAGFWLGLWHGCIALFTVIGSLFIDDLKVYEVHNNGGWYDFGFLLGVMLFFGGSGGGASKKSRRRR